MLYAAAQWITAVERVERRRYDRLREVLGTEGIAAPELEIDDADDDGSL